MRSLKPWPDPTPLDSEILGTLQRGVVEYDESVVISVCETVIQRRMDAYMAIFEGLVAGMSAVGELFDKQEYFVPELLMCADTLYAGLTILEPHVKNGMENNDKSDTVIFGTTEGDIHDIGKNLVSMVFDTAGFNVLDLGKDVPIKRFVKEAKLPNVRLICLSIMMTTCLPRLKELVSELRKAAPKIIIMVGGAIVSDSTFKFSGADATAPDAHTALREAIRTLSTTVNIGSYES
jgi:methanogenic corrinoid protein MtbC1